MYRYFNSSDLNINDTVKYVTVATISGIKSLISFVERSPLPAGSVFRTAQHAMNMKKLAITILKVDVKMCLRPVILSFLWRMVNRIII